MNLSLSPAPPRTPTRPTSLPSYNPAPSASRHQFPNLYLPRLPLTRSDTGATSRRGTRPSLGVRTSLPLFLPNARSLRSTLYVLDFDGPSGLDAPCFLSKPPEYLTDPAELLLFFLRLFLARLMKFLVPHLPIHQPASPFQ